MPRKGVPYGGAICSLKERIAELFDLVGEKLHSINGVQGDGQGNVQIVSGDPAVVIANNAAQNEIEIALDKSKLPSAMVTSVNGESGPVFLKARDIPSDGHSNVQDDIDSSRTSITALAGDIIIERQMRQKTDAALQTNINRVQASIPEAAAAAVSNNPTVARLAADVPSKVDKITSGSTKRAYTHTGAVQDDTPVVNGTDANSIGLRDANGRMHAADPASGATDRSLTTANWISQTGNNAPNNLIHKTGNETKSGQLTMGNTLNLYNAEWTTAPAITFKKNFDSTLSPTAFEPIGGGFTIKDANDRVIWQLRAYRDTNGRDVLSVDGTAYDGSTGFFHFEVGPNNNRKITTNFDKPSNW